MKHKMNTFSTATHDSGEAQDSSNGNDNSNINNNKENTNEYNECKGSLNDPQEYSDENTAEVDTMDSLLDSRRSLEMEKIRRHKLQAAEDIERYKKEKLQRVKEKEEEKKRDLQMLTEFYPWGTKIGKFERGDYRRQKWDVMNNTPRNQNNSENRTLSGQSTSNVDPATHNQSDEIDAYQNNYELSEMERDNFITDERNEKVDVYNREIGEKNNDNETANWDTEKENPTEEKRMYYDCGGQEKSFDSPRQVSSYSMRNNRMKSPSETMRARAARVYMEELKKGMEEQRKRKEEMKREYNAPVGELAAVIGMGKVGKPRRDPYTGILLDNHLRTSDISKIKMGYHFPEDPQFKTKYCNDLITAAEERYRLRELEKLKMKQQEKQHQDTFNGVWGRPGGGAPRDSNLGNRISNISQIFYKNELEANKTDVQEENTGFQKSSERTFRFSSHQNCYDFPTNKRNFKDYNIRTPWANFY